MLGAASLQTSQLALNKAVNPQVKLFAKFEVAEQETMGMILKDMGTPVPVLNFIKSARLTDQGPDLCGAALHSQEFSLPLI
jgi:hypothetical protein